MILLSNVAEVTGVLFRNTGKFVGEVSNSYQTSSDVVQNMQENL